MTSSYITTPSIGESIDVEMGEIRISSCLTDVLVAYGLGACVGVCIYDHSLKIAGLAHIVLPERQTNTGYTAQKGIPAPGKFAETAIPSLVEEIVRHGGIAENLRATIVGGAHIFSHTSLPGAAVSRLEIGQRNVTSVTAGLTRLSIPIIATDVGGCHGRTVSLRVCDGMVSVRPIGADETILAYLNRSGEAAVRTQAAA